MSPGGNGVAVYVIDVAQVHDVIDHELIVGIHVHMGVANTGGRTVVQRTVVGQLGGIGGFVTHPYPDESVFLQQRISRDFGRFRYVAGPVRVIRALSGAIEFQGVVMTDNLIAVALAQVQRGEAVWATVAHGHRVAVLFAIKQYIRV